jgi:hypothetical protein
MDSGDDVWIPAPALAECCHIEDDVLNKLRVQPFNAAAAILANRLFPEMHKASRASKNALGAVPTRRDIKVDAMILATAESMGAKILYVGCDDWFAKIVRAAKLKVEIRELPPFQAEQIPMVASP